MIIIIIITNIIIIHISGTWSTSFTVPQKGCAKRGSKKRLLLSDFESDFESDFKNEI